MRDIQPPQDRAVFNEMLSWMELPKLLMNAPALLAQPRGGDAPVTVLPGFGAGDLSTAPLRQYLQTLGYRVSGWANGINTGDVQTLIDEMRESVFLRYQRDARPISLVGWSLGGYIAREVARDIPDTVRHVVTMGSPVVGGPKYTRVAPLFSARGMDLDVVERMVDARYNNPLLVPVTAIYSRADGVVAWEACIDHLSNCVEHVEVNTSHLGLGISAEVFGIIAKRLAP